MELFAPAKINLTLDVLGKRPDGYHEVEMIMQTIALADKICLEHNGNGMINVKCSHPYVPSGKDNLAWKAAQLLRDWSGCRHGVDITIEKSVPVSAGLGGGSADAAAVLRGLNQLWALNLKDAELRQVAQKVGADVPFCLQGGTALARGVGERLTPLPSPPRLWVVLLKPNLGVSTAETYKAFDPQQVRKRPDNADLIQALESGNISALAGAMGNVLESVTFRRVPLLRTIKQKALEMGALAALMTGSGPTVFALESNYRRAITLRNGLSHMVDFAHVTSFKEGFK